MNLRVGIDEAEHVPVRGASAGISCSANASDIGADHATSRRQGNCCCFVRRTIIGDDHLDPVGTVAKAIARETH
jgi:hypothetical protein